MGHRQILTACVLGLLAACAPEGGDGEDVARGDSILPPASAAAGAATAVRAERPAEALADTGSAQSFWTAFREATLAGDSARIAGWVRFPLAVHGVMDSDPVEFVGRDAFWLAFAAVLDDFSGDPDIETVRDLVTATPTLAERNYAGDPEGDFFGVGALTFQREDGRWRLTRLYREES